MRNRVELIRAENPCRPGSAAVLDIDEQVDARPGGHGSRDLFRGAESKVGLGADVQPARQVGFISSGGRPTELQAQCRMIESIVLWWQWWWRGVIGRGNPIREQGFGNGRKPDVARCSADKGHCIAE